MYETVRKEYNVELKKFCIFADGTDFISLMPWENLEGYTVEISRVTGEKVFQLTEGEFKALQLLVLHSQSFEGDDV